LHATTVWGLCCDYLKRVLAGVGRSRSPRRWLPPPPIEAANCGF